MTTYSYGLVLLQSVKLGVVDIYGGLEYNQGTIDLVPGTNERDFNDINYSTNFGEDIVLGVGVYVFDFLRFKTQISFDRGKTQTIFGKLEFRMPSVIPTTRSHDPIRARISPGV